MPADLVRLAEVWGSLPRAIKAGVLAMVRAAMEEEDGGEARGGGLGSVDASGVALRAVLEGERRLGRGVFAGAVVG